MLISLIKYSSALIAFIYVVHFPNSIAHTSDYESYCSEVALSCIENCQVFKHKCSGTYLAEIVKKSIPGRASDLNENKPLISNYFPSSPSVVPKQQENCKTEGNVCAVAMEYQRSECCPGQFCVPFHRENGQRSGIGACKVLDYVEKIDPRITKD